tara:strand:- start:1134 stop:1388 length:255 start_codon:yes stop_codon:yes gene_type:complete
VYNLGDLVIIIEDCPLEYFIGKLGIINSRLGRDYTMTNEKGYNYDFGDDSTVNCYYSIMLVDGQTHIFSDKELAIVSKGKKENV